MTAQDLKNSILQQAIQGKLVPQNPADEPASELLKKIATERQKLIDEGKIKNATPLPPIEDDEKPFDIPDNWCWARLGDVCNYGANKTILPAAMEQGKLLIDLEDIEKDSGKLINRKFFDGNNANSSKNVFRYGQVLFGKLRVYLNKVIVADNNGYCSSEILPLDFGQNILSRYAQIVLMSPMFISYATACSYGTKMPRLGTTAGQLALFPLPPLAEQKRIVAKLEELMPLLERYDAAEKKISTLDKEFPDKLRKSILQQAIKGKLTEQLSTDGDARDLLEKIRAEKAKLIADCKIKKEKPLPPIGDDEKPFDIPGNWQWIRLGDLSYSIQYGYTTSAIPSGKIKILRISDIQNNSVDWDKVPFCEIEDGEIDNYLLKINDILFARTGGTVGKSLLVENLPTRAIFASYLIRTNYHEDLFSHYLKAFMESPFYWTQLKAGTLGTAQPNCNGKKLSKMVIPLPPLAEQERIVAKLNELLPLCDSLSERIKYF